MGMVQLQLRTHGVTNTRARALYSRSTRSLRSSSPQAVAAREGHLTGSHVASPRGPTTQVPILRHPAVPLRHSCSKPLE